MPSYIKMLNLEGHEEGGYFALFYKSADKIIPLSERYNPIQSKKNYQEKNIIERHAGSSIYFLLERHGFSAWHRLKSDEIWHYYDGDSPLDIHVIGDDKQLKTYTLGNPGITKDSSFQIVVKAGAWFAAEVRDKFSFCLVGCTVSPAFEYEDFELAYASREQLIMLYPELTSMIDKFIKPTVMKSSEQTHDHTVPYTRNKLSASDYIQKFKFERHPTGGYFHIAYKATDVVVPLDSRYRNQESNKETKENSIETYRFAGSSIYLLLDQEDFSAWHQSRSDEIWHYYDGGSSIDIHVIDQNGHIKMLSLGNPLVTKNASFQVIIKAGEWFATEVRDKTSFGLVGCTGFPGFEYSDSILANRSYLVSKYPAHKSIINRLTRTEPAYNNKSYTMNI